VIPQEYPNITCRSIDITIPKSGTWQEEKLINQLYAELALESSDFTVAYRGFHRWVQTFEPIRLDKAVEGTTPLREGGVYLITGGLGGIGFTFAQYLAQTVRAKLVLIGRKAFPDTKSWGEWLATHDEQDDTSRKIRKVQALEELGSQVLVKSADVTNHEEMLWVITQASERFGQIHGVIHTAGIAGGGMIQLKTPEAAASVLAPKVQGAQVLELLFKDEKLDFLVLCSSLSSFLGEVGQVDYCAANAFLDAFARHNCAMGGTFTVSINWDTWREVGMAVNTAVPTELIQRRAGMLEKGISPTEGVDVISRILCSPLPQVAVSTQDIQARIEHAYTASSAIEELEQALLFKPTYRRPQLENAYAAPRNEVEQTVADIWQRILGIERVGIYDNFFDLGGHSLLATQLISHLRDTFQVELPMQTLFESLTVADSAIVIAHKLAEEVSGETFDQMLAEIEQLSEDEVLAILGTEK
jgi:NAD(P)-dependent dehydrogenase (short-subunit alcohol dehydrogenase family)/acyl carrier protein